MIFIELQIHNIFSPGGQVTYLAPQWAPMFISTTHT